MKNAFLTFAILVTGGLLSLHAEDQAPGAVPADAAAPAPLQLQQPPLPGEVAPAPAEGAAPADPATTPEVAPAVPDPSAPTPDSGMGSPGQNPPPADPNSLIPPPAPPEQPSPVNTGANDEKQRQDQKTRYYTAKVTADKEEALASLQEKADKAKSDEAKRQALREYYDLLAKRMKKIDPSLSEWIDTMHSAYLRRLEQVRVEPTIPVNPPPSADATPTPSPSPKKKKRAAAAQAA